MFGIEHTTGLPQLSGEGCLWIIQQTEGMLFQVTTVEAMMHLCDFGFHDRTWSSTGDVNYSQVLLHAHHQVLPKGLLSSSGGTKVFGGPFLWKDS
jgi:hypothetical protein